MVWSSDYEMEIGEHVFPTGKYRLVLETLLEEETVTRDQIHRPEPAPYSTLGLVHTTRYLRKLRQGDFSREERWRMEIPFSPGVRRGFRISCGGSLLAARLAVDHGTALHLGGGFHHAFPDHAEGFCLLNDVAVSLRALRSEGRLSRAAVVDLDVHHGNGTAAIFAGDRWAYTLSLHQEDLYPARKPPGDRDVGLPGGTGDRRYLEALERVLPDALEEVRPDLVIYLAGADPYRRDQLGGLALTRRGLARRDERVIRRCRRAGVPVAILLAGGYAHRLEDTVEIHCATARIAANAHDEHGPVGDGADGRARP